MGSVNKVLILGRLTRDPELKYTPSGAAVCEMSVALNRTYTKDEKKVDEVSFIDVVAWARTAENCAKYLAKGREVHFEGYLKQERWEKDGQKRSKVRLIAERVTFVGPGPGKEGGKPDADQPPPPQDIPF